MHMADALLSPAVGGAFWAVAGGTLVVCARRVEREPDDRAIPLMGVLGAFVFAVQMINFTIPGTGSSGHLGGGLLLAILLGPGAAFLAIASVLLIQALFFADGGLLALGCNLFNLGFFPCFVGLPLFRLLAGGAPSTGRLLVAAIAGAGAAGQLGALAVVLETLLSGIAELPVQGFAAFMLAIHLPISLAEGVATALILGFVRRARPEVWPAGRPPGKAGERRLLVAAALAAIFLAGGVSWFASDLPDGLEWSILRVAGAEPDPPPEGVHASLDALQGRTAVLRGYEFPVEVAPSTGLAGLVGGGATLVLVGGIVWGLRRRNRRRKG